jgi:hypothetical protein
MNVGESGLSPLYYRAPGKLLSGVHVTIGVLKMLRSGRCLKLQNWRPSYILQRGALPPLEML